MSRGAARVAARATTTTRRAHRAAPRADASREQVRVQVAQEQDGLEEHQDGRPDRRCAAEHGQDEPPHHRLRREQQERRHADRAAEDERRRESAATGRATIGLAREDRRGFRGRRPRPPDPAVPSCSIAWSSRVRPHDRGRGAAEQPTIVRVGAAVAGCGGRLAGQRIRRVPGAAPGWAGPVEHVPGAGRPNGRTTRRRVLRALQVSRHEG